jgi:tRNA G18 (ribose-2'-O)-methylase SpoU
MTPSTLSSSWVVPFVLGAATSLSLVWINQNWNKINKKRKLSRQQQQQQQQQQVNEEELIDSPDLDHRMLRKCEAVIQWRTNRLILVVERCTNDHNYSAILRTAEALGIQTVFMIDPPIVVVDENGDVKTESRKATQQQQQQNVTRTPEEIRIQREHHLFAQNATEWLTVQDFETSELCVSEIRRLGYELWVTDLSQEAEALSMSPTKLPDKIALVMGTEAVGASQYMLDQADKRVYLPLRGFADSLNLSVATALIIHHFFVIDPSLIGAMDEQERRELRRHWFVKLTQQRLLSASQKKARTRLIGHIRRCEEIAERKSNDPHYFIQPEGQKKLDSLPRYRKELDEIEAIIDPKRVERAIQEWIDNPPEPLTDLRRADTHRVCFVGKNTKQFHTEHWKDMPATANFTSTHGATATTFREKVQGVTTVLGVTTASTSSSENGSESKTLPSQKTTTKSSQQRREPATKSYFVENHF